MPSVFLAGKPTGKTKKGTLNTSASTLGRKSVAGFGGHGEVVPTGNMHELMPVCTGDFGPFCARSIPGGLDIWGICARIGT